MHKRRLRAPSPALVIAVIALFVALGGTTYAATSLPKNSVGSKQLKKNAVTSKKIKNGSVTSGKIAGGAVTGSKIGAGAVGGSNIASGAVGTGNIAANAVTTGQIADNAVTSGQIAAGAVGNDQLGNGSVSAAKLGSFTVRSASGDIATGSSGLVLSACNAGERLIGIGYLWSTQNATLHVQDEFYFLQSAAVRGWNASGATVTLTVQAVCLATP